MNKHELISWLKRGRNRIKVFKLVTKHTLPSEIVSEISGNSGRKAIPDYAVVSRALSELKEKGLVKLMVSEKIKVGRTYQLTEKGKKVSKEL